MGILKPGVDWPSGMDGGRQRHAAAQPSLIRVNSNQVLVKPAKLAVNYGWRLGLRGISIAFKVTEK